MKVLIVRVGALGDVLHALPAVAALRAARPEWQIDWVVDPRWMPLLVNHDGVGPVVTRVHLADTRLWSRAPISRTTLRSVDALRRQLRAERYDVTVDMQGTLRSAVIARLSGAPVRAGYSDPREPQAAWFYTRRLARRAPHVVEQGAELLQQVFDIPLHLNPAAPLSPLPPLNSGGPLMPTASPSACVGSKNVRSTLPLPPEPWADDWAATEAASGPLCLLAAGAGWAAKQWPLAKFAALARELRAQGFDVVVNAPRKDDKTALRLVAESGPPGNPAARMVVCNVAGLIALLRRTALVVGGDTGPTHIAAALGIPLVALFGPTDPARNGPWFPGAQGFGPTRILRDPASITSYKHTPEPDPGLARISVEQVLKAITEVYPPPALSFPAQPL